MEKKINNKINKMLAEESTKILKKSLKELIIYLTHITYSNIIFETRKSSILKDKEVIEVINKLKSFKVCQKIINNIINKNFTEAPKKITTKFIRRFKWISNSKWKNGLYSFDSKHIKYIKKLYELKSFEKLIEFLESIIWQNWSFKYEKKKIDLMLKKDYWLMLNFVLASELLSEKQITKNHKEYIKLKKKMNKMVEHFVEGYKPPEEDK
jgi:hypothetical protein